MQHRSAQHVIAGLKQFSPRFFSCFPQISLVRCRTSTSQVSGRRRHDWPGSACGPGRAGGPTGAAGVRATKPTASAWPKQRCPWCRCFSRISQISQPELSEFVILAISQSSSIISVDSSQQGIAAQCGLIMVSTAAFDFCRGGKLVYHGLSIWDL